MSLSDLTGHEINTLYQYLTRVDQELAEEVFEKICAKKEKAQVECPYSIGLKKQKGFVCLADASLVNCFGKVLKLDEDVESSPRLKVRKVQISYLCTVLEEKLNFSNVPEDEFDISDYIELQSNPIANTEAIKTRVKGEMYKGDISEEKAIGEMIILFKWPNPIKDNYRLNEFNDSFVTQLGEMFLQNELTIADSLKNSIRNELKISDRR